MNSCLWWNWAESQILAQRIDNLNSMMRVIMNVESSAIVFTER